MNANLAHNILNVVGLVVGALVTMDWTMFGMTAENALFVAGCFILADKIIKLTMNIFRDGLTGLTKVQPPVGSPNLDTMDHAVNIKVVDPHDTPYGDA